MEKVMKTQNYDKFIIRNWNRTIKQSNLKKIDKSVQKNGWLVHPIIINDKMEVIDGQHRLVYAREHGLPVYYTVVEGLNMADCITMNNTRSSWNVSDYVNYYAATGNDNYVILKNMIEKYSFIAPSTLVAVIKDAGCSSGTYNMSVKDGSFTLTTKEYENATEKLDFLERCASKVYETDGRPTALFGALSFAYNCPGVDKERLEKRVLNDIGIIVPPANLEMALKQVELLYNYRIPRDSYVYIYTEYKRLALERISNKRKAGK